MQSYKIICKVTNNKNAVTNNMQSYKYAKLQICEVTNMRSYDKKLPCEDTVRSCKDTNLQRYEVAKIRSCKDTKLQIYEVVKIRSCKDTVAKIRSYDAVLFELRDFAA